MENPHMEFFRQAGNQPTRGRVRILWIKQLSNGGSENVFVWLKAVKLLTVFNAYGSEFRELVQNGSEVIAEWNKCPSLVWREILLGDPSHEETLEACRVFRTVFNSTTCLCYGIVTDIIG